MRAVVAGIVAVALWAGSAQARPGDVANDVAESVMSPFCPGLTLHDCSSAPAERLRARIEAWAQDGLGRAAIMRRLRAEYGPAIAAAPQRSGAGWIVWLLPAAVALLGLGVGAFAVRRWAGAPAAAGAAPGAPASADERSRLDADLRALRGSS